MDGLSPGIDAVENGPGSFRVGNLQTVVLVQSDNQLECIHGIEPEAAGAEKGLFIADFFGGNLEHAILHEHFFDFAPQSGGIVHS